MTVKDVFDLRRQGRIEEAYDAIRPMYAAHKGRYTTLCMFWTASDIFKKRLEEGRINEAAKILEALKRMQPRIEEINKDLDTQATATPAATATKLPWEKNEQNSPAPLLPPSSPPPPDVSPKPSKTKVPVEAIEVA